MKIIEKYTGEKTYMFPNGAIANKQAVLEHFPAALDFVHIVETDEAGEVMWAFQNLSAMRTMHKIDRSLRSRSDRQAAGDHQHGTRGRHDTVPGRAHCFCFGIPDDDVHAGRSGIKEKQI